MAATNGPARAHDRHARRRPFANWMKRLANLKNLHTDSSQQPSNAGAGADAAQRGDGQSGQRGGHDEVHGKHGHSRPTGLANGGNAFYSQSRSSSTSRSKHSASASQDGQTQLKSRPATLGTTAETAISDGVLSGAGTSATAARTEGDRNSTFSSPAPSVRSMATTLTTVQSAAPTFNTNTANTGAATAAAAAQPNQEPATAPSSPNAHPPYTAIPAYLAPHSQPTTYHSLTANNALTDDASIRTLASSSKRRRRNSLDTNASVRALAPQSVFGGSRESLPLSVLSGTIIHPGGSGGGGQADNASLRDAGGSSSFYAGTAKLNAERASLISASGVNAPTLASERNSYIGSKYGDGASVRSGLLGGGAHGRNDSVGGGGIITEAATAKPGVAPAPAPAAEKPKIDRKSSDLGFGES